jgi:hypothetical protein
VTKFAVETGEEKNMHLQEPSNFYKFGNLKWEKE